MQSIRVKLSHNADQEKKLLHEIKPSIGIRDAIYNFFQGQILVGVLLLHPGAMDATEV